MATGFRSVSIALRSRGFPAEPARVSCFRAPRLSLQLMIQPKWATGTPTWPTQVESDQQVNLVCPACG